MSFFSVVAGDENAGESLIVEADSAEEAEQKYLAWAHDWGTILPVASVTEVPDYSGPHLS
jgi:hypothetical protein